jgi:hypothetical protein
MLKFSDYVLKRIDEIAEPIKTNAIRRMVTKHGGTWREKKVVEYKFKTSLGNEVKIHFDKISENPKAYNVVFYVNDTQYDDASKTEGSVRDPEVLGKVVYLIRKKSDDLKAQEIQFVAQKGKGDIKVIRNIDVNKYKPNALFEINKFYNAIVNHQVNMIPAKRELFARLNIPVPPDRPSINKEKWLRIINGVKESIVEEKIINVDELETSIYLDKINDYIDTSRLVESLRNYANAVISNTGLGWIKNQNRRESLYSRLVEKYFADWDVEKKGDSFILRRKIFNNL